MNVRRWVVLGVAGLAALMGGPARGQEELAGTLSFSGAWALYPMAVRWGEEFQKLHPKVRFDISAGGAGKGMTDALAGAVDAGLVSRELNAAEIAKGAWAIAVTRDAVVPMVNQGNPVLADLQKKGARRDVLAGLWLRKDAVTWGQIAGNSVKAPVRVFTRSDACGAAETWAKYLGANQEDLKGTAVYGDPGLAEAVRKDTLGVGFNNLNFAYDLKTQKPVAGIRVVPIDIDGNGKVDPGEDFYGSHAAVAKAIADGKYPSPPARALHLVTRGKPGNPAVVAFLRWVLTDGQKYVSETGFINLTDERLREEIKKLE